jgi:hypothetical protein
MAVATLGSRKRPTSRPAHPQRRERVGSAPTSGATAPPPVPAHRRVEAKRRTLDRLARRWAQLRRELDPGYAWPQAQARANRAMGVTRRVDATEAQLDEGLAFLRTELAKLARLHPEEAERLRIPASVEAIDERLSVATDDR